MHDPEPVAASPADPPHEERLAEELRNLVLLSREGQLDDAEQGMRRILAQARTAGLESLTGQTLYRLSYVHDLRGDYHTSAKELAEALEIASRLAQGSLAAACHFARGRQLMVRGRLQQAIDALGQSLMYAQASGSAARQADAYLLHGECYLRLGLLADAYGYASAAVQLLAGAGGGGLLHTLVAAAAIARQLRRTDEAAALINQAEALAGSPSYDRTMSEARATMALDCFAVGDVPAATAHIAVAESLALNTAPGQQLHLARGKYLDGQGRFAEADEEYMAAQRLVQQRQSRYEVALMRLERAPGVIAIGELGHAHAMLLDAELAFEHFDAPLNLGRCYCGWVAYFLATGNFIAAETALQQAENCASRIAGELGLQFAAELQAARLAVEQHHLGAEQSPSNGPQPLLHPASTLY